MNSNQLLNILKFKRKSNHSVVVLWFCDVMLFDVLLQIGSLVEDAAVNAVKGDWRPSAQGALAQLCLIGLKPKREPGIAPQV